MELFASKLLLSSFLLIPPPSHLITTHLLYLHFHGPLLPFPPPSPSLPLLSLPPLSLLPPSSLPPPTLLLPPSLSSLVELPECRLQIASNEKLLDQFVAIMLTPTYKYIASQVTVFTKHKCCIAQLFYGVYCY